MALTAIKNRPWVMMVLVLGLAFCVLGGWSAGVAAAQGAEGPREAVSADDAIPDLVVTVVASDGDDLPHQVEQALQGYPAVRWTAIDTTSSGSAQILVGLDQRLEGAGVRAVVDTADQLAPDRSQVAGRALTDQELLDRIQRGVWFAALGAAAFVAVLAAWVYGVIPGLLGGFLVMICGLLGGSLGQRAAGAFDGSPATTRVPAVLAALLVSAYLVFRLLDWFRSPAGDDQADMIRRSIRSLGVELGVIFGGLLVASVFVGLFDPGRSVVTLVLVGAVVATLLVLAVAPPVMAGIHVATSPWIRRFVRAVDPSAPVVGQSFPFRRAGGSVLPLAVVIGGAVLLALVGILSFRSTDQSDLADEHDVAGTRAALGAEALAAGSGDPTQSVLAVFPSGLDQAARTAWLERVSLLNSVGRVDSPVGRHVAGEQVLDEGVVLPLATDAPTPAYALVVPTVGGRSDAARALVADVRATDGEVDARLSGPAVDARTAQQRDRSTVWATIVLLTLIAGAACYGLTRNTLLALATGGLHLLDSMATVGAYQLVAGDPSGPELQLLVVLVAIGAGFVEFGVLARLGEGHRGPSPDDLLTQALDRNGWAAVVGLAAAGTAAFGLLVGALPFLRQVGLSIPLVLVLVVGIGVMVLRPVVLGWLSLRHLAAPPVAAALGVVRGDSIVGQERHQEWVGVVGELLQREFRLQADPLAATNGSDANAGTVFVPDSALHRASIKHNSSLADAGLRVVGDGPQLRNLRAIADHPSPAFALTVDYPESRLLDRDGTAVGVRKPERRSVLLWLVPDHDPAPEEEMAPDHETNGQASGRYRILNSVDLGTIPVAAGENVPPAPRPVPPAPVPAPVRQ